MPGWASLAAIVGAVMLHALLLTWAAFSHPALATTDDEVVQHPSVYLLRFVSHHWQDDSEEEPLAMDERPSGPMACPSGGPCNGGPGAMGDPLAPRVRAAYGVAGPADNPDPHIARSHGFDYWHGYGFELLRMGVPPQSLIAPWGRDDALGVDPFDAPGKAEGPLKGRAKGLKGLGGRGGKTSGVPHFAAPARAPTCEAESSTPQLPVGAAAGSAASLLDIRNRIQQQEHRFQPCFDAAKQSNPELRGQVLVHARINGEGDVVSVADGGSVGASKEVVGCFLQAFESLALTGGDGSGISEVLYPFPLGS